MPRVSENTDACADWPDACTSESPANRMIGPGGSGCPQDPFPVVAHQAAVVQGRVRQLDGAENVAQVYRHQALRARLHQDVLLPGRGKSRHGDFYRIMVGRQPHEMESAAGIGKDSLHGVVLAVEQYHCGAQLRNPREF